MSPVNYCISDRYVSILILLFLLIGFFPVHKIYAAEECPKDSKFGCFEVPLPGLNNKNIDALVDQEKPTITYINAAVNIVIGILVLIGLISIIIGGYMYMTAGGNAERVSTAKTMIGAALAGIALAIAAVVVLNVINPKLGKDAEEPKFKNNAP